MDAIDAPLGRGPFIGRGMPRFEDLRFVRGSGNYTDDVSLPEQTYAHLRAEAERTHVPATALARVAIDWWLRQQLRKARHDQIAAYAAEMAGTDLDLDLDLEAAGIERLRKTGKRKK